MNDANKSPSAVAVASRDEIIEECARVCEAKVIDRENAFDNGCWSCAASIRTLKDAAPQGSTGTAPDKSIGERPAVAAPVAPSTAECTSASVTEDGPIKGTWTTTTKEAAEFDLLLTQLTVEIEEQLDEESSVEDQIHHAAEALKLKRAIVERYTPRSSTRVDSREALVLAQSALRRWTQLYAHLQNECGEVVSRKLDYNLPPGDHVRALEAIADALNAAPSTVAHNSDAAPQALGMATPESVAEADRSGHNGGDGTDSRPATEPSSLSATSARANPAVAASFVRRYREASSAFGGGRMVEKDSGEWVKWADVQTILSSIVGNDSYFEKKYLALREAWRNLRQHIGANIITGSRFERLVLLCEAESEYLIGEERTHGAPSAIEGKSTKEK